MTIKTERTCKITIVLSEEEARALRTILKSPSCSPTEEPDDLKLVRIKLCDELHEALGGWNPAG